MKIKTSRWRSFFFLDVISFFFPAEMSMKGGRIVYEETESLIFFWDKCRDSLNINRVTAIRRDTGVIWDEIVIDSSYDEISIKGLKKSDAKKFYDHFYLLQGGGRG